ncbi:ejaculatory bulb-specific protein 3-like [Maniola jurtina]|uniref:ejaculatory bulb-specific protein 3-like n=1 Tax=Maniola jurtina TaxID=191418 RepID=UPI001E68E59F|nr:ejaculatory bulb-specific protein 3-like [Maniola jurtina]XP_045777528.1 ejaculatory bulb-specific protein 3-like [Maniola jurtina]
MKWVIILSALVVLAAAEDKYTSEHDDFDVDALAKDPEELKIFLECFTGKGPCRDIAAHFKKDIPEAVVQACAKCTDAQKHIFKVFLEAVKAQYMYGYRDFKDKYDPENKYLAALEAAVANY